MEEERRLCYVGMTRAEKRLYLSWARYRRRFGEQVAVPELSIRSRFLQEKAGGAARKGSRAERAGGIYTRNRIWSGKPRARTSIPED